MKLHTVLISYNRMELTKRAIESYLDTVSVPFTFCVVDNGSTDGSAEWIEQQALAQRFNALLCDENRYPGYACNRGWEQAPLDADFLHRADNDNEFLAGWSEHVQKCFHDRPDLGQLGLRTAEWESFNRINVAGDCIIRRELWDQGLRWQEKPWSEYPVGTAESLPMAKAVQELGYRWDRVRQPCIQPMAYEDPDDPYYIESWRSRGILKWALKRHGFSGEEIFERVQNAGGRR